MAASNLCYIDINIGDAALASQRQAAYERAAAFLEATKEVRRG